MRSTSCSGRPLRTRIPSPVLVAVTAAGLAGALALGVFGVARVGWALIPFMVAGPFWSSPTTPSCSAA